MNDIFYITDGIDPYKQYGYWDLIKRGLDPNQYEGNGLYIKPMKKNAIRGGTLTINIKGKDKKIEGEEEIIDFLDKKITNINADEIEELFEKVKDLNPEKNIDNYDINNMYEYNNDINEYINIMNFIKNEYKNEKRNEKKADKFYKDKSKNRKETDLNEKIKMFNEEYNNSAEDEKNNILKKNLYEGLRNYSIDERLNKMETIIDNNDYKDFIQKIINIIVNSGEAYGSALESLLKNPSTFEEKVMVEKLLHQVADNYKKSDKIVDNNDKYNNKYFVIDMSLENKQDLVKLLLELKNQISSQAKNPKWITKNFKDTIKDYKRKYEEKKKEIESKMKDSKSSQDKNKYKDYLRDFRTKYDTLKNDEGILFTNNKLSGTEGSTVPIVGKDRKIKSIDEYYFDKRKGKKIDEIGMTKDKSKLKGLFLLNDAMVQYDASKDGNNKLVKKQIMMDNNTGKPKIDLFGNIIQRVLYNPDEYFFESSYPLKQKEISSKKQLLRVIPPHKTNLIKNN